MKTNKGPSKKSPYAARLAKAGEKWQSAREEAKRFGQKDDIEDGMYFVRPTSARITEVEGKVDGKKVKELKAVLEWTIVRGDEKGKKCTDWWSLERDDSRKWVVVNLQRLGVDVDELDFSELEEVLKGVVKERALFRGEIKNNGDFVNIRIKKKLEDEEAEEDIEETESEESEETESEESEETESEESEETEEGETPAALEKDMVVIVTMKDGKERKGTIVSLPPNAKAARVQFEDDTELTIPVERLRPDAEVEDGAEDEESEGGDEEVSLEVGQTIKFKHNKKTVTAKVVKLREKDEIAVVKVDGKLVEVAFGDIQDVMATAE